MDKGRARSQVSGVLMEALEGRELFSMVVKLPEFRAADTQPAKTLRTASSPADLTVLPVKTKIVVEESTGGVLAVVTHQGYKLPGETSSGTLIRAVINWGDGTFEAATLSRAGTDILVSGNHIYHQPGYFHAIVKLIPYALTPDPVTQLPPAVDISNTLFTVSLNSPDGRTVRGGKVGQTLTAVIGSIPNFGGFSPAKSPQFTLSRPASGTNPQAAIKATVLWGDGTTSAAVFQSNSAGGFDIFGSHTYVSDGTYRVRIIFNVSYNGGPFANSGRVIDSLVLVGQVPGNTASMPVITFPLTKFKAMIPID